MQVVHGACSAVNFLRRRLQEKTIGVSERCAKQQRTIAASNICKKTRGLPEARGYDTVAMNATVIIKTREEKSNTHINPIQQRLKYEGKEMYLQFGGTGFHPLLLHLQPWLQRSLFRLGKPPLAPLSSRY